MRFIVSIIFLFLALSLSLKAGISRNDEGFIPFYAELTQSFKAVDETAAFEIGTRFIIIRPIDNDMLLVEFPRRGVYEISPTITNVEDYIQKAKGNAETSSLVPRMSYFLANRIISGESDWQLPLRSEDVNRFTRWILLYGDSSEESTLAAIKVADVYYKSLAEAERRTTALVYLDTTGNKAQIQSISDTLKPSIQSMPGYLSRGYSKSLVHIKGVQEFPVLVEAKSSGRVVLKCVGLESVRSFFNEQG